MGIGKILSDLRYFERLYDWFLAANEKLGFIFLSFEHKDLPPGFGA